MQLRLIEQLSTVAGAQRGFLPSTLLIGPRGSGKRTIARGTAERLGIEFVEVPLSAPASGVLDQLRGTVRDAEDATERGDLPGQVGCSGPTLLYLTGLENAEISVLQFLQRACGVRKYHDANGGSWRLSDELWIVCGLTFPASTPGTITPEHWVVTSFNERLNIDAPRSAVDLLHVFGGVVSERNKSANLDPSIGTTLATTVSRQDNLHAVRRWAEWVSRRYPDVTPSTQMLQEAIAEDLHSILPRIEYRGKPLSPQAFESWATQFPDDIQSVPMQLVRLIADHYYIGTNRYFEALERLIQETGVQSNDQVVFCRWQCLGRSAPRVAHDLKNQGHWRAAKELDLDADQEDWPNLAAGKKGLWIILADDFVGSGGTMSRLFHNPTGTSAIDKILRYFPTAKVRILIVAGFEVGLRRIQDSLAAHRERVALSVGYVLKELDQCFTVGNRIFPDSIQCDRFRQFCLGVAETHYPRLPNEMRLGHSAIGALTVFFDTVPNNSLPILWHNEGTWVPLFPASGLLASLPMESCEDPTAPANPEIN